MKSVAWLLAACCLFGAQAAAQDPLPDPSAPPQAEGSLRDPEFGVRTSHFGLERRVEMFQWREEGGSYARGWSDAWVDSSAFPPGHENPDFPLQARRWSAENISIDGVPLDPQVLQQIGNWREFRPGFSALPGNLAATFQPQGNGLGSALNPLAPEVGDLRIHWRELVLPPLQERIELRAGRWQLRSGVALEAALDDTGAQSAGDGRKRGIWWLFVAALVPVALAVIVLRRRRRRP